MENSTSIEKTEQLGKTLQAKDKVIEIIRRLEANACEYQNTADNIAKRLKANAIDYQNTMDTIANTWIDDEAEDCLIVVQFCKELANELKAVIWDLFVQSEPFHFTWFTGWKLQSVEPFNPQGTPEQRFIDGPYLVVIEMEVFNNGDERQVVHYMKEVDVKYYYATDDLKLNLSLGKNERIVMWARQDDLIEGLKGLF